MSEDGGGFIDRTLKKLGIKKDQPKKADDAPKSFLGAKPLFSEETSKRIANDEPAPKPPEHIVGPIVIEKPEKSNSDDWKMTPDGRVE